jgi:hypothetical protein
MLKYCKLNLQKLDWQNIILYSKASLYAITISVLEKTWFDRNSLDGGQCLSVIYCGIILPTIALKEVSNM